MQAKSKLCHQFHRYCCEPATHQIDDLILSKMNALLRSSKQALQHASRSFASSPHPDRKVALLGAAGGIGQPLGLLLKVCGEALFDGKRLTIPRIGMGVYMSADIALRQPPLTLRYCWDTRSRC